MVKSDALKKWSQKARLGFILSLISLSAFVFPTLNILYINHITSISDS